MAKIREDQPLVPSVLDRLIDLDPQSEREPPKSRNQVLREMKVSIGRDLENLLNTRWRPISFPAELDQLDRSLINYGIPDFASANMSRPSEREHLRKTVEQVIRKYEPRFKAVKVELLNNDQDSLSRTLRFRIDALLHAEPAPEPVVFDSQLEPATSNFHVQTHTV